MYYATLQDWMEIVQREYARGEIRADEILPRLAAYVEVSVSLGNKFNAQEFVSPFIAGNSQRFFAQPTSDREVFPW